MSLPARGVWIEIWFSIRYSVMDPIVTPREGGVWVEITMTGRGLWLLWVTPREGSVG